MLQLANGTKITKTPTGKRWPSHIPWSRKLPEGCDHVTGFILGLVDRPCVSRSVEAQAGNVGLDTLRCWLYRYPRNGPEIKRLIKLLDVLGYELVVRKKEKGGT